MAGGFRCAVRACGACLASCLPRSVVGLLSYYPTTHPPGVPVTSRGTRYLIDMAVPIINYFSDGEIVVPCVGPLWWLAPCCPSPLPLCHAGLVPRASCLLQGPLSRAVSTRVRARVFVCVKESVCARACVPLTNAVCAWGSLGLGWLVGSGLRATRSTRRFSVRWTSRGRRTTSLCSLPTLRARCSRRQTRSVSRAYRTALLPPRTNNPPTIARRARTRSPSLVVSRKGAPAAGPCARNQTIEQSSTTQTQPDPRCCRCWPWNCRSCTRRYVSTELLSETILIESWAGQCVLTVC